MELGIGMFGDLAVHSHTFLSGSKEQLMQDYFPYYAAQMNRVGRDRGWSPYTATQFQGGMQADGALFMGNAEDVAEKIIHTIELFGLTRFIAHVDVGFPSHQQMMKTIELYGGEVLPLVRKHFESK